MIKRIYVFHVHKRDFDEGVYNNDSNNLFEDNQEQTKNEGYEKYRIQNSCMTRGNSMGEGWVP